MNHESAGPASGGAVRSRSTAPPVQRPARHRSIRAVLARTADDLQLAGIAGRQKLQSRGTQLASSRSKDSSQWPPPRDLVEIGKMIE